MTNNVTLSTVCVPSNWGPSQPLWQSNFTMGVAPLITGASSPQQSLVPTPLANCGWPIPPSPDSISDLGQKSEPAIDGFVAFAQTVWKKACEGWSWLDSAVTRIFRFTAVAQAQEVPLSPHYRPRTLQEIIGVEMMQYAQGKKNLIHFLASELSRYIIRNSVSSNSSLRKDPMSYEFLANLIVDYTQLSGFYNQLGCLPTAAQLRLSGNFVRQLLMSAPESSGMHILPDEWLLDDSDVVSLVLDKESTLRAEKIAFCIVITLNREKQIAQSFFMQDLLHEALAKR